MNLTDLFDLTLKGCAGETALEFCDREWTFGELEANSNRLAHHLIANGFQAGDRLAVYLANCVELIEAYLAAIKLGLIFTPINALYREWEIGHILSDSEPRAVLTNRSLLSYLPSGQDVLLVEELAPRLQDQPSERPSCPATGDTVAVLVYTSGTTGRPKGAALTHNCAGSAGTGERALRVSVDAALRAGIFKASGSFDPMGFWDVRGR